MAGSLRLLWASSTTEQVETDDGMWIISANRPAELAEVVAAESDVAATVEACEGDDAVAVRVGDDGRLDAYRSITATRNVYVVDVPDGPLVVTDNFRNAVAELPVAERTVSTSAIVDHLLFRNQIEPNTYVTGVRALEHGTHFRRDAATGEQWTRLVERLAPETNITVDDAQAAIDDALRTVLDETVPDDGVTNMLSGGVDSTLLQTYLGDVPALVMETDSPEFAFEIETAETAAEMLDASTRRVVVEEADFLAELEASVDALGFPSHYNQTVLTDAAFRASDGTVYLNGEGADALFGLRGVKGARIADFLGPLFSIPGASTAWTRAFDTLSSRAANLPAIAARLDRPLADPDSFAQRFSFFTDPGVVAQFTDARTVAERFRRQSEYVDERVERSSGCRFADQVSFGQLLSAFRHNTVAQWRQLGHVHGHSLVAPFKTRRLTTCALSIPAEDRYIGRLGSFTSKHLLKSLLVDRLPAYPARQPKGAGSLPVERYFDDGPLADVFERYEPPSFVPDSMREEHVEQFGPVTWNLVTFAVWRDRVLQNPNVSRVPGTTVVER